MEQLAIYDMDKTITRRATFPGFLRFAGMRIAPARQLLWPLVGLLLLGYGLKLIDRGRLKELMHGLLLGPMVDPGRLAQVAEDHAAMVVATGLLPLVEARIASDRAEGCRLVMATASFAYYASSIGEMLGFEDTIGTVSRRDKAGNVLPLIDGENCYGPVKLQMIDVWLADHGMKREALEIRFYSDHASDRPVLDWADQAYVVNPDGKMRLLATERGWPILW